MSSSNKENGRRGRSATPPINANRNGWFDVVIDGRNRLRSGSRSRSQSRSKSNNRGRRGSSPSPSPAPPLKRMPSRDALDRSSHNAIDDDDGIELSKDEIIVRLKKANAALTDKTAEMEANFMNQCNTLSAQVSSQENILRERDEYILSLNTRITANEKKLKEKDAKKANYKAEAAACKEDNSFQKQSVTDLKNQLYTLQNEIEDFQFERMEESGKNQARAKEAEEKIAELERERKTWVQKADEAFMERDLRVKEAEEKVAKLEEERLSWVQKADEAVEERDFVKRQLLELRQELEENTNLDAIEIELPSNMHKGSPQSQSRRRSSRGGATSPSSITSEVRQNWKSLEEAQEKLLQAETTLHQTQSKLATLEHKYASMKNENGTNLKESEDGRANAENKFKSLEEKLVTLEVKYLAEKEELTKKLSETQYKLEELETSSSPSDNNNELIAVQLEETQKILRLTEEELQQTQQKLKSLEKKYEDQKKIHEDDLAAQVKGIRYNAEAQVNELRSMLRARDDTIINYQERLEMYNDDLTKLQDEMDEIKAKEKTESGDGKENIVLKKNVLDDFEETVHKSEVDQLNKDLEDEKKKSTNMAEKYQALTETVKDLEEGVSRLNGENKSIGAYKGEIAELEEEIKNIKRASDEKINELINEQNELVSSLEEEKLCQAGIEDEKRAIELKLELNLSHISELENTIRNIRNDTVSLQVHESTTLELVQAQELCQKLEHDLETGATVIQSLRDELNERKEAQHSKEAQHEQEAASIQKLRDELSQAVHERNELESEFEDKLSAKERVIEKLQAVVDDELNKIQSMEEEHTSLVSKLHKLQTETNSQLEAISLEKVQLEDNHASEIFNLKKLQDEKNSEHEAILMELGTLRSRYEETESNYKSLLKKEQKDDIQSRSLSIETLRKEISSLSKERSIAENNYTKLLAQSNQAKSAEESKSKEAESKLIELETKHAQLKEENTKQKTIIESGNDARQDLETQVESLEEEKRELSSKYEAERDKLSSQLEETRVLMNSLYMNVGNLEKEKSEAEENSRKLKEEKHEMILKLTKERDELMLQLEKASTNSVELNDKISALEGGLSELEIERSELKTDLEGAHSISQSLQEKINKLLSTSTGERDELEAQLSKATSASDTQSKVIAGLEEKLVANEAKVSQLEKERDGLKSDLEHSQSESTSLKEENRELLSKLDKKRDELALQINEANVTLEAHVSVVEELEDKIMMLEKHITDLEDIAEELEEAQEKLCQLEKENADSKIAKDQLEEARHELRIFEEKNESERKVHERESLEFRAKVEELNVELEKLSDELQKRKDIDPDQESVTSSVFGKDVVKRSFYLGMERKYKKDLAQLKKEKEAEFSELVAKVADRDTTISAMSKAAVMQEKKVKSLNEKLCSLDDQLEVYTSTGNVSQDSSQMDEVVQLQATVKRQKESQKRLNEEIVILKKQIEVAAKSGKSSENVHELLTELAEYKAKVKERDGAISTLVKSSITQEQQITTLREEVEECKSAKNFKVQPNKGPSWEAFNRVSQESEIFAGQIIEQDEEIESLRQQLDDERQATEDLEKASSAIDELQKELDAERQSRRNDKVASRKTIIQLQNDLDESIERRSNLEMEIGSLKSKMKAKVNDPRLDQMKEDLEDAEETNKKLREDMRALRKKMKQAEIDAECIPDLEAELFDAKAKLKVAKNDQSKHDMNEVLSKQLRVDLEDAIEQRDASRTELANVKDQLKNKEESHSNTEGKLRAQLLDLQENEIKLKDQVQSQKTLKNLAVDEKEQEFETLKSEMDASEAKWKKQVSEMQEETMEQKEVINALSDEVKKLRGQLMALSADDDSDLLIAALTEEVNKLRSSEKAPDDSKEIIAALTEEVKKLRNEKSSNYGESGDADIIDALKEEVQKLRGMLQRQQNHCDPKDIEATVREEIEEEIHSIKAQREFFGNEVARLQEELTSLQNGNEQFAEMKKQLAAADEERAEFEKKMVSTYERKLSLIQMNKDLTIDGLRKDLAQTKERQKDSESELQNKIRDLEAEKVEFEAELTAKMQHKNAEIQYLTNSLAAHEQVSGNMKQELDQLQSGMESVSVTRRAEVEEMQDELMDAQSKVTKYEREITALKMEKEEAELRFENDIVRLNEQIDALESEKVTPMMRDVHSQRSDKRVTELTEKMETYRKKVSSLQNDNQKLREKLKNDNSSKNDKWRKSALAEQVFHLTNRLREYESGDGDSVKSWNSRQTTKSTGRIPPTVDGSRRSLPRSPGGSVIQTKSRKSVRDDISTHTEMTF